MSLPSLSSLKVEMHSGATETLEDGAVSYPNLSIDHDEKYYFLSPLDAALRSEWWEGSYPEVA